MKTLILVRHAKSSWKFPELDDFERPLNKRGKRDAPIMGKFLEQNKIMPDIIISSPAVRAKRTATRIAEAIGYSKKDVFFDEEVYEASTMGLLNITNKIDNKNKSAMLFGHNPSMTYFANMLTNSRIDNIPTCGIACVDLKIDTWMEISENCGTLRFFEYPKNIISI